MRKRQYAWAQSSGLRWHDARYCPLGGTDLTVSAVSLGTAPRGGMFGAVAESDAITTVHRALDAGITFFGSSPCYQGAGERRLGMALRHRREQVVIGTKAGRYGLDDFDFTPQRLRESLHRSLHLLNTDYVDILQLHDIEFVNLDGCLLTPMPSSCGCGTRASAGMSGGLGLR